MKNISLTFLVHHPVILKRYRFFDIGHDDYYYDDYANERRIRTLSAQCYLPNNNLILELLKKYKGDLKIAFSLSGTVLDLFSLYAPEVIESFQQLAATGDVEFFAETYSHSLASLMNFQEFGRQVEFQVRKITKLFGKRPVVFKNTELICTDTILKFAGDEGFSFILSEEPSTIQNWKGPNHIYCCRSNNNLKILYKNNQLSSEILSWLLNNKPTGNHWRPGDYISRINSIPEEESVINLCINYGMIQKNRMHVIGEGDNNLEFFLINLSEQKTLCLKKPSELLEENQPVTDINLHDNPLRAGRSSVLDKFQGNELQQEALEKLYRLKYKINPEKVHTLWKDWQYLQSSDHFYYMSSRFFTNRKSDHHYNPYENPYEAFINYMNVLSDFTQRLYKIPSMEIAYDNHTIRLNRKIVAAV